MPKTKPCMICRRWFAPHPRAGDRQKVCGGCQGERHRRACAAWREAHPAYDRMRRLKEASGLSSAGEAEASLEAVVWPVIEQAIGPAHRTVIEAITRLLLDHTRDAVARITTVSTDEVNEHAQGGPRDAVASITKPIGQQSLEVPPPQRETQCAREGPDP